MSKDSKIAGMEILSSKVTVNGGDIPTPTPEPDDNSSPNLGLILGICIPVGVICNLSFYFSNWYFGLLPMYQKEGFSSTSWLYS